MQAPGVRQPHWEAEILCLELSREEGSSSAGEPSCDENSLKGYSPWGLKESDTTERACAHADTHTHTHTHTHTWAENTEWVAYFLPTPVFLPGESHERGSLVGCRLWGRTELDTTEAT